MNNLKQFSKEIGIMGFLGAGYMSLKSLKSLSADVDDTMKNTVYLKKSHLAFQIAELKALECREDMKLLVDECEEFLRLTTSESKENGFQFNANRNMTNIKKICTRMCDEAKRSGNADRIDAAILCIDDYLPSIEAMCNSYLQNMLM